MTQSGTLLGTPSYMSPEQAMGDKLDGRSDIFSLGVCAFEMLSGEQPFPGTNVTSILYKLVHVDPIEPPELEMHGLVPQKWHEVFGKVLAKKPDDRYQTATELRAGPRVLPRLLVRRGLGDEDTVALAPMAEGRVDDTVALLAIERSQARGRPGRHRDGPDPACPGARGAPPWRPAHARRRRGERRPRAGTGVPGRDDGARAGPESTPSRRPARPRRWRWRATPLPRSRFRRPP